MTRLPSPAVVTGMHGMPCIRPQNRRNAIGEVARLSNAPRTSSDSQHGFVGSAHRLSTCNGPRDECPCIWKEEVLLTMDIGFFDSLLCKVLVGIPAYTLGLSVFHENHKTLKPHCRRSPVRKTHLMSGLCAKNIDC